MFQNGLPAEVLLLFTILIWTLYFLIYISSPENKVNQWCCICGFLLSIGVLKEYFYYSGIFAGTGACFLGVEYALDELINSILTAVLYYIAMPCVMIFSFYFCHLDKLRPRLFRFLCFLIFVPVLAFGIVYPWSQTRVIPLENPSAFFIVSSYNLIYGVIATIPILITLFMEMNYSYFRQRRLVSLIALLPLWYWLITLFLIHMLKLEFLYKLWQGNALILAALFVYYVRHLFRDGIWGMRLNREYFNWEADEIPIPDNIRHINHMLKNELAKLSWCSRELRGMEIMQMKPELDIIDRSVSHISEFVRKTSRYAGEINLNLQDVDIRRLFEEVANEMTAEWQGKVKIYTDKKRFLHCDYDYMKEVLCNLTANALEAMGKEGELTFSCLLPRENIALIRVKDTGTGITQKDLSCIFDPYFTEGKGNGHMGLGLAYCRNVIKAHGGYIQVKTQCGRERHGTVFTICIPAGTKEKRRKIHERINKSTGC